MNRRDRMVSSLEAIPQKRAYSPGASIYDTSRAAPNRDWRNRFRGKHVQNPIRHRIGQEWCELPDHGLLLFEFGF